MIEIMPVMFIPAGVGLMESWGELKARSRSGSRDYARQHHRRAVVSGRVTQAVIRWKRKTKEGTQNDKYAL